MKAFISPRPETAPYGLQRVMEALYKHLPECGIEIVNSPEEADVVNVHSMAFVETDKPIIYTSHGLHWAEINWPREYLQANQMMINYMKRSQTITAVSDWVAHSISRGILKKPIVIGNGIDTADWQHDKPSSGYVLWNKARTDLVCDPEEMNKLAAMMPDVPFVSTFGRSAHNVQITGVVKHDVMKDMVQRAGVYLSLARETFGIGTLEAIASGVPVVGWDHGGNRDIIEHGVNGFLVPYGNYEQLVTAVRSALEHRETMRPNLLKSIEKWEWSNVIPQYAEAFRQTLAKSWDWDVKVSILVTAYNLGKYLGDCLQSVEQQDFYDWECLIIDDCSTDNTPEIAAEFCARDGRFKYFHTGNNLKLSGARNYGYKQARGQYIMSLDADDMIHPHTLRLLCWDLDQDRTAHIVYGCLDTINEDGSNLQRNPWPSPDGFNWDQQMAHLNQLPYCAMMRREVYANSGGYRIRDYLAEDAALWCRVTSLGYRAKLATDESTLIYRLRPDSKSTNDRKKHGHGAFTQWFGWKTAVDPHEGMQVIKQGKRPNQAIVPFGAQGNPPNWCWPVWSHHDPIVSVIIPVGPGHEGYLVDALDSLTAQTYPFWEAVVINDTGKPLNVDYAPWARVYDNGRHDIASSRNIGIEKAKGHLLLFLDADDFLSASAIERMLQAYLENDGAKYIYTDWYNVTPGKEPSKNSARPYDRNKTNGSMHPVSALVRREHALAVGGFDSSLPGWEDWEFFVKMAIHGFCGQRLSEALLVYRLHSGKRREDSLARAAQSLEVMRERYADYYTGAKQMAGCCGGDGGSTIIAIKKSLGLLPQEKQINISGGKMTVRLEYTGSNMGAITIKHMGGINFNPPIKAGAGPLHKYHDVTPEQAKVLVASGRFRQIGADAMDLNQAVQHDNLAGLASTATPPDPERPFEPPAPDPQIPEGKEFDPTSMTVTEIKQAALGCTVEQLEKALKMEIAGQNRKSAVAFLEVVIEDSERLEKVAE